MVFSPGMLPGGGVTPVEGSSGSGSGHRKSTRASLEAHTFSPVPHPAAAVQGTGGGTGIAAGGGIAAGSGTVHDAHQNSMLAYEMIGAVSSQLRDVAGIHSLTYLTDRLTDSRSD